MSGPAASHPWGTPAAPLRHALLFVEPAAYALALADRPELAGEQLLANWARLGRPLVARRRARGDAGLIAAGLPLPPSHGKKRVAFALSDAAIQAVEPPPALARAAGAAPPEWRATSGAILDLCLRLGVDARVFGALAWSSLTGLPYLTSSSDLDLLFAVEPATDVAALLDGLARIDATTPMRLDGEIVRLDQDAAANWRELHGGSGDVLVKTSNDVLLLPAAAFIKPEAAQSRVTA